MTNSIFRPQNYSKKYFVILNKFVNTPYVHTLIGNYVTTFLSSAIVEQPTCTTKSSLGESKVVLCILTCLYSTISYTIFSVNYQLHFIHIDYDIDKIL